LVDALNHTDASIGQMMTALQNAGLFDSTYIVLTDKHGQGPVDPAKLTITNPTNITGRIDPAITHVLLLSGDNVPLVWLADQSRTTAAVGVLLPFQVSASVQDYWANDLLKLHFPDPLLDPRTPDIIALTKPGTIYTTSNKKIAEHGGFSEQDLNVPILVSNPQLFPKLIRTPVQTAQIAPTILTLLGLNPLALQAVQIEGTKVLPGFDPAQLTIPSAPSRASSPVQLTNGRSQFQLSAGAVETFSVQASTDLTNWVSIGTNALAVGGSATITDPDAASFTNRFYRAVQIP
jgi:arylsulfatase A-like enzyme